MHEVMLPGFDFVTPVTRTVQPFQRGMDGSKKAALKWTPEQATLVDAAIVAAASAKAEITTDDVWNRLPEDFPITKGTAVHMLSAKRRGILLNTTRVTTCTRSRNNNAQRLSVWASLIYRK